MKRLYLWLILTASIIILAACVMTAPEVIIENRIAPVYDMGMPHPQILAKPKAPGHFFVVTVDRLTIQDIYNNPELFKTTSGSGALGLMNVGVEGSVTPESCFASIGAGAPVNASGSGAYGVNAVEQLNGALAADIFYQRTGMVAPEGAVLQEYVARLKKLNELNRYSSIPGYLGTLLRDNGVPVEVYGNSDSAKSPSRPAVGMTMDNRGIVPHGDVSDNTLVEEQSFPGGLRTDYQKLLKTATSSIGSPGLTVIELGDLQRLEYAGDYLEDAILQARRLETLDQVTAFIDELAARMDPEQDMLLVVSPTPKGNNLPGTNLVTPVLALGQGVQNGILTSPTTRRPGVIKNTDLAPTVLQYFNISLPGQMFGRPLQLIPTDNAAAKIYNLYNTLEQTNLARPPILRNYVLIQIILVGLSLIAIFLPRPKTLMSFLKPLLLAVMAVPAALLLVPALPHPTVVVLVTETVAITAGITSIIYLWLKNYENDLDPFIFISLLTSLCILADIFLGSPLQKNSVLGYDPIAGARFYGIGNEYMGVLIGATIIGTTALVTRLSRNRKKALALTGLYYLFTLYAIAAPQLGTNVGGSIAAVVSFLITFLLLTGIKFNLRTILKMSATVGLFLLGLIFYDASRPLENQSHIGRTANLILQGGVGEITNIITRKLSMNIKLIRYTIWSRVFLASLASLIILFFRPVGVMQRIFQRYPDLHKGFIGVVVASIVALIFNDSGVVAAATAMIYGAPPLLYLVIRTMRAHE